MQMHINKVFYADFFQIAIQGALFYVAQKQFSESAMPIISPCLQKFNFIKNFFRSYALNRNQRVKI